MADATLAAAADAAALADLFGVLKNDDREGVQLGTVKWYDPDKGFGFITPDSGGPDVFVHRSSIHMRDGALGDGQRVEFRVKQSAKGPRADAVKFTFIPHPDDQI